MDLQTNYQKFKDGLVALVNGSGLPAFLVGEAMRMVLAEVDKLTAAQAEKMKAEKEGAADAD